MNMFNANVKEKYSNSLDFAYMSRAYLTKDAFEFISKIDSKGMNEGMFIQARKWLNTATIVS